MRHYIDYTYVMGQQLTKKQIAKQNNYIDGQYCIDNQCYICLTVGDNLMSFADIYGCFCYIYVCGRCLAKTVVNSTKYIECMCGKQVEIRDFFDRAGANFKTEHFAAFASNY